MAQSNSVFPNGIESGARSLENVTVTTKSSAAAVTYTATEFVGGFILRDPNGGARTDVTPSASEIDAYLGSLSPLVGASFIVTVRNTADASETITMSGGTGVTISGTATIAENNQKSFLLVKTAIDPTYEMYSLGTVTF